MMEVVSELMWYFSLPPLLSLSVQKEKKKKREGDESLSSFLS